MRKNYINLRELLSACIFDDSGAAKAGGMVRITGVRWTSVHPFKQFENRLAGTGRDEHTAGGAVSLNKSLRFVDSEWVLAVQRALPRCAVSQ